VAYKFSEKEFLDAIEKDGVYLAKGVLSQDYVQRARKELEEAIDNEAKYHGSKEYQDYGMVLVCAMYGGAFLEIFENKNVIEPFNKLLGEGCIVYANTSTSMPPSKRNYSSRVHVDSPRVIPSYHSSFMSLILLDDFTEENGATWYLPGSHKMMESPTDDYFYRHAKRLIAPAGSVFFWSPRVFHAGGANKTDRWRHAFTFIMCRPYMKQRVDLPRLLEEKIEVKALPQSTLQKLGFYAQVPASYDEYYAPPRLRKFKQKTE